SWLKNGPEALPPRHSGTTAAPPFGECVPELRGPPAGQDISVLGLAASSRSPPPHAASDRTHETQREARESQWDVQALEGLGNLRRDVCLGWNEHHGRQEPETTTPAVGEVHKESVALPRRQPSLVGREQPLFQPGDQPGRFRVTLKTSDWLR